MHLPSLDTSRLPAKGFALAAREHAPPSRFLSRAQSRLSGST
jgi:hypothetical protein